MKRKFLLPVLAMIFAIGMSFTTVNSAGNPDEDYIIQNGTFMSLGSEVSCGSGAIVCRVQLKPNGPLYDVYDANDPSTLKRGNGIVIKLY